MRHATLVYRYPVKILLFVGHALGACLLAIIQDVTFTNADVLRGVGQEFYAIVAAVVGGCCSLAAMGSAIGAMFGALVFGIVEEGIVFAGIDANWYKAFIGFNTVARLCCSTVMYANWHGGKTMNTQTAL